MSFSMHPFDSCSKAIFACYFLKFTHKEVLFSTTETHFLSHFVHSLCRFG